MPVLRVLEAKLRLRARLTLTRQRKICSVNFRLFSADKERSEFEKLFRVRKNPSIPKVLQFPKYFNSQNPSIPKIRQFRKPFSPEKTTIRLSFRYYGGIHYLALLECICFGVAICHTSGIAL